MNGKKVLIKYGYSVEVPGYVGNEAIWEVVDYHFVEEVKRHDFI